MSRKALLTPEERHARKLARTNRWRAANQEHLRAYREANKDRDRALVRAWEQANPDKVLARTARYRAKNRALLNAKQKDYEQQHPERVQQTRHEYYMRNQAELQQDQRDRRAVDPEAYRAYQRDYYASNSEHAIEYQLAWVKAHPEANRLRAHKRRAILLAAPRNDLTREEAQSVIDAAQGVCCYCSHYNPDCHACRKGTHKLTLDHITALINGGSHTLHNMVACCKSCNSKKRTRPNPVPVQPLLL